MPGGLSSILPISDGGGGTGRQQYGEENANIIDNPMETITFWNIVEDKQNIKNTYPFWAYIICGVTLTLGIGY